MSRTYLRGKHLPSRPTTHIIVEVRAARGRTLALVAIGAVLLLLAALVVAADRGGWFL